jgi:dihydrofolate synthase/folylpolyglutamate synthase
MNYQQAWSYLDNLQFFKIKLGLDSMTEFLVRLDSPERHIPFVHVAGTNGKGSVSVTLLTVLARAGYKVGLYTSPHLSSVRERFRINDHYISEDDFAAHASKIRDILNKGQITYFEFTTALALLWFAAENVDLAIMETGLGGRLDATNVISPLISVITNVTMDHEAYLGNTLAQVAGEKAGIIKPDIPLVTGVASDDSLRVVQQVSKEKKAPMFLLNRDFSVEANEKGFNYSGISQKIFDLFLPLKGEHQLANTALALAVVELLADKGFPCSTDQIRQSLPLVFWPGRLEYFSLTNDRRPVTETNYKNKECKRYLLDGAHNPAGVKCLRKALQDDFDYQQLIMVWAGMADKDLQNTLPVIAPDCHRLIFCRPEEERSATPEEFLALLDDKIKSRSESAGSVSEALRKAEELAGPEDLICVAGSLYLIGAARRELLGEIV